MKYVCTKVSEYDQMIVQLDEDSFFLFLKQKK